MCYIKCYNFIIEPVKIAIPYLHTKPLKSAYVWSSQHASLVRTPRGLSRVQSQWLLLYTMPFWQKPRFLLVLAHKIANMGTQHSLLTWCQVSWPQMSLSLIWSLPLSSADEGPCLIPLSPIPLCSDPASIVTRGSLLFIGLGSSRMPLACLIASETPLAAFRSSFGPFNVLWVLHSDH